MYLTKALGVFFALTATSTLLAQSPTPGDVQFKDVSAIGTGCKEGTFKKILTNSYPGSNSLDYLQLSYDDFVVERGRGIDKEQSSKYCNVAFNMSYPKGYRFYFESMEYDGTAQLDGFHQGLFKTRIQAVGAGRAVRYAKVMKGRMNLDYTAKHTREELKQFKSSCEGSQSIRINNGISLSGATTGYSTLSIDRQSKLVKQGFHVRWEKCAD